jgi:CRP/FNR family cyclic AMP-dependent transcriptional regulator
MPTPYGLDIIESCVTCKLRSGQLFCNLPEDIVQAFESLRTTVVYPRGSILFVEGQSPRGVYLICTGRAKLSTSAADGKTLIVQIAEAGEVLGASAAICGGPHEVTAETLTPCQMAFIKRDDFLAFLSSHGDASLRLAQILSNSYRLAHEQIRSLGLSHTAGERLARLLLSWCEENGKQTETGIRIKVGLTHEEISQLIGTSRETVTRMFGDLKKKQIAHLRGSTLLIRNKAALESLVSCQT